MARLVIGCNSLVAFGYDTALLLRAHQNLINALVQLGIADKLFVCARGEYCRLVKQVCKVRTREARSYSCNRFEVNVG